MEVFKNHELPRPDVDKFGEKQPFSVDVIIFDEQGMLNIGYYNYDTKKWGFLAETLVDPYEKGEIYNFVWMYRPAVLVL